MGTYEKGSEWMDANLFNGKYYEQHIQPPMSADNVAKSLIGTASGKNAIDLTSPDFQLGEGVLVDQLIDQMFAKVKKMETIIELGNFLYQQQCWSD
jgi:hypothetical protein